MQLIRLVQVICARLKLANKNPDPVTSLTAPGLSASETVSLLIAGNLYEDAIRISKLFSLDVRPIGAAGPGMAVSVCQAPSENAMENMWSP